MVSAREMVWRRIMDDNSFELAHISPTASGAQISGLIVAAEKATPLRVDYTIDLTPTWETRAVSVCQTYKGETRRLHLARQDAAWTLNGARAPNLDGCTDIDLGLSPSTNALPINRLALRVGNTARIGAAWVKFPSLDVVAAEQSYERTTERQYRYRALASGFEALIDVDSEGFPIEYKGIWRRIAEGTAAVTGEVGSPPTGFTRALVASSASADLAEAAGDFDWVVGGWSARVRDFDSGHTVREGTGEWWFSWVLDGRAIQDVWISPPRDARERGITQSASNRYGTSLRWFDAHVGLWRVQWINPVSGAFNLLTGRRGGDRIVLFGDENGRQIRWSFHNIKPTSFRWRGEAKKPDGSWELQAEFDLRRIV